MPQRSSTFLRRGRPAMLAGLLLVAIVVVVVVVLSTGSSKTSTSGGRRIESIFQDDQYLLYEPTPTVVKALGTLRSLGVDEIRVTVLWRTIAPGANSPSQPAGFVASDPAAYPAAGFALYDRLVELARNVGLGVDFNVTAAGPLWAMQGQAPQAHYAFVYQPSARDFGQFVVALGRRYSGSYVPSAAQAAVLHELGVSASGALPRVSYWSIWNEPNQPGWLAPQWRTIGGSQVMESPVRYRHYVDAAWKAFTATGHGTSTDTVLVGELAPEGGEPAPPGEQPIAPIPFLQALYCVGASYQPLTGSAATELGCPAGGGGQSFASEHPGLFDATGFAHHPYSFFLAPNVEFSAPQDAGFVPLVSLSRLENGLDRIFGAYGLGRKIPIYLTEYGYETNPPNPFRPVTLQQQAMYIDEAQYMAWNDPRVRSMSQFLLRDAPPNPAFPPGSPGYWSTFQTGLEFANGAKKPAFQSYRLPIWIPVPTFAPGSSELIWGMLRPVTGSGSERAEIQWRGSGGGYRTLSTVTVSGPSPVFTARVTAPGTGTVRIQWTSPSGKIYRSRGAAVQSG